MNILLTGASGFIGGRLAAFLHGAGHRVTALVRHRNNPPAAARIIAIPGIEKIEDWRPCLEGNEVVIHLAGYAGDPAGRNREELQLLHRVNVEATGRLAENAARHGIKRFVYLSSAKIYGEESGEPLNESTPPAPASPYARSKWQAEQTLREFKDRLAIVVLRPPLVYGPQARGNFRLLLALVRRGMPLPFAMVRNRRSFLYIDNLIDAIHHCLHHPAAANQTYVVSDNRDCSLPRLLELLATAMGRPARLWPVPPALLNAMGLLTGRRDQLRRLTGSLFLDTAKIRTDLSWRPPVSFEDAIRHTAAWYRQQET